MSLKQFHMFFLASSTGMLGFLGYWAISGSAAGSPSWPLAACALSGLTLILPYGAWFWRRYGSKLP